MQQILEYGWTLHKRHTFKNLIVADGYNHISVQPHITIQIDRKNEKRHFLSSSEFGISIQSKRNKRHARNVTNQKMRSKHTSLIDFKEINLISDFLYLIE